MDRPDLFVDIPLATRTPPASACDADTEEFLRVLRWWFAKDLKHIHGQLCKPYNSVLGEHFLCHWDVPLDAQVGSMYTTEQASSSAASSKYDEDDFVSAESGSDSDELPKALGTMPVVRIHGYMESPPIHPIPNNTSHPAHPESTLSLNRRHRVALINEQISHHPPVSAFVYTCPELGMTARGVDHLAFHFNGTSLKVGPGDWSDGVFLHVHDREYHLQHGNAFLNGWLRGRLYISMVGQVVHECKQTGLRCVLNYKNEKWTGKLRGAFTGQLLRTTPGTPESVKSMHSRSKSEAIKPTSSRYRWFTRSYSNGGRSASSDTDSPAQETAESEECLVGTLDGSWRGEVYFTPIGGDRQLLIDLEPLRPWPKQVRPLEEQGPYESRRFWQHLTNALLERDWNTAQRIKHDIEEEQRRLRKQREERGEPFVAEWMDLAQHGKPKLKKSLPDFLVFS